MAIHILSHNRNFIDAIIVIQRIHNHTKSNPLCILRDTIPEFFNIAYNSIKTTTSVCKYTAFVVYLFGAIQANNEMYVFLT